MAGVLKVRQAYTSNHHKQPINGTIFEKKKKMTKKKPAIMFVDNNFV